MKKLSSIFILLFYTTIIFSNQLKFEQIKFEQNAFINSKNKKIYLKLSLAKSPKEQKQGLMNIKKLKPNNGMLFCFSKEDYRSFWMKNTYISLDIIFLDKNMKIIGFVENTTPLSHKSIHISKKSQYVLELNAGFIKKHNIKISDYLKLIGLNKK